MSKFKVGDTVMVRYWDDMAREYMIDGDGDIGILSSHSCFTKEMRKHCGKTSRVREVYDGFGCVMLSLDDEWGFPYETLVLVEAAKETPPEEKGDEEPKACPLCGGQVEAYTGEHKVVRQSLFVENILHCKDCGLELKRETEINCDGGGVIHDGYAEVVADWNRKSRQ